MLVAVPIRKHTVSEVLFEEFCRRLEIPFNRIPVNEAKTPDYDIHPDGHLVTVEVKQIDANEDDKRAEAELQSVGHADIAINASDRIRNKIKVGGPQLKRRAKAGHPSLLVLYDNVHPSGNFYTAPDTIKTAMFGCEQVVLSVPQNGSAPVAVRDRKFGPKRKMTPQHNTSISAVAVMIAEGGEPRELRIYHNPYGAIPLPPHWLPAEMVKHFKLAGKQPLHFQHWTMIGEAEGRETTPGTREAFDCTLGDLVGAFEDWFMEPSQDKAERAQALLQQTQQEFAATREQWETDARDDIAGFLQEVSLGLGRR